MRFVVPFLLFGLLATPTQAQVLQDDPCPGYSGADVIGNIDCMLDVLKKEDAALNAIWKQAMANHPSGGDRDIHKQDIRKSQRAWIAFRDLDCEAVSKVGIPKYWELNRLSCLVAHTRARTATLKYIYVD